MSERTAEDIDIVDKNFTRYTDVKGRGHLDYVDTAIENENFYLGGGRQWKKEDRDYLEELGRPVLENNGIFPAVNTAVGMQIKSRVEISFKPRGDASDEQTAELLSKIAMQVCDDIHYQWLETQVFEDGLIEQRGYFDFRVDFNGDNMQGEIVAKDVDPRDVLPDPDANSYDPDTWNDVIVIRWMTLDDIEETYGKDRAKEVENFDVGSDGSDEYQDRNRFGVDDTGQDANLHREDFTSGKTKKFLIIDRQYRKLSMEVVYVTVTGDVLTADDLSGEQISQAVAEGAFKTKRMRRRIMWCVTTADILLHNEWSPYDTFTIIPYFPYFRRGKTLGMVDNAKSPQENLNKNSSLYQHIVAGIANSGWLIPKGSLTNMTTADVQDNGGKTGLVMEYDVEKGRPEKINPSNPPSGIDKMIDRSEHAIKTCTGISDEMKGQDGMDISGVAREIKHYQGTTQLGSPLDHLARTQYMVAKKLLSLIQSYFGDQRVIMITDTNDFTEKSYTPLQINVPMEDGTYFNDVTLGDYDVVVSSQPISDSFRDNQYNQAMDMRDKGVNIPDEALIGMSNMTNKSDVIKSIREQQQPDPELESRVREREASADLKLAQGDKEVALAEKARADSVNTRVDSKFSAVQTAGAIVQQPDITPLADELLKSSGDEDLNLPPLVPEYAGQVVAEQPGAMELEPNTDPLTPVPPIESMPADPGLLAPPLPDGASVGVGEGIETKRFEE